MAVAFQSKSTGTTSNAQTSIVDATFSPSGTNLGMVCWVAFGSQAVAGTVSVTWDNNVQNLTQIGATNAATGTRCELWGLINPNQVANVACKAAWTGTADVAISTVVFSGVDTSSFANAFKNYNSALFTSAAAQVSITSNSNDMVTGGCAVTATNITSVSGTQIFLTNAPSTMSAASNYDNGAASVTLSSSPNNTGVYVGVDVAAPAGKTPYQPYFQQFLASKKKSIGWTPLMDPRWRKWRRERGILRKVA